MIIAAYFSEDGSPKIGLSPTLDIIDPSDDSVVINDGAMTEVGQGWYKYTFAGYDNTKDYVILCDSVTLIGSERYAIGSTEDMGDTLQVKAKTDNLPASPAPASEYDTEMARITANVATEAKQDIIDTVVDAIKNKTDNLPTDPADQSQVETAISASESNIRGADSDDLKDLSDQLDIVQVDLTFLKDIEGGRWKLDEATNQMVFYKADNVTEVCRFNMFDKDGNLATENVFERVRV